MLWLYSFKSSLAVKTKKKVLDLQGGFFFFLLSFREFHLRIPSINPISRVSTTIYKAKSVCEANCTNNPTVPMSVLMYTSGNIEKLTVHSLLGSFEDGT